jgi:hypothetical protein
MQLINAEYIRTFNPCKEGIEEFETKYPKFNNTLAEFLKLEEISWLNKIWLATKVANIKTLQQWSVECAESVLHIYETAFPNDKRVRDCIEVTKKVIIGELPLESVDLAVSSARYAAAESVPWSAKAAAESAVYAARLVSIAAVSATWTPARSAARSAESVAWSTIESTASSAVWAAESEKEQQDLNLSILIALLENA